MANAPGMMRTAAIAVLLCLAAVAPVRADPPCPIPDDLALRRLALPAARTQTLLERRLVVLTFGGVHPDSAEGPGASWPASFGAALSAALPGIDVVAANVAPPGATSADVPSALPNLIEQTGATLVVWAPGARDVGHLAREAFRHAVADGIEAVRDHGADLILIDTAFVPSPSRMAAVEAYQDRLLAAAATGHTPLLHRHDLMRRWSENGTLNLEADAPTERNRVVRRLYACVAQALADPIAAAVRQ